MLEQSGLKAGDEVDFDIPMVGGGITIHKIEQRVGEEVV